MKLPTIGCFDKRRVLDEPAAADDTPDLVTGGIDILLLRCIYSQQGKVEKGD